MSDDNIIQFPGAKTPEDLEFFKKRSIEYATELNNQLAAFLKTKEVWDEVDIAQFFVAKIAGIQAGLELTMKTVIERSKR